MSIAVDFSFAKPTAAQLKSWGAVAAGMYLSRDPAKNATRALVDEYAAAGVRTFLFFEDTAANAQGGYAQGKADAELARSQAAAVGKPPWAPILAAVDFDIPDLAPASSDPGAKLGPVADYFRAFNDVLGKRQTGGYGGYWAVSRLAAAGLISVGVQTVAWSGGQVDTRHIAALQNATTLDNGNVDVELIESASLLAQVAWVPGEADPLPAPAPAAPARPPTAPSGMVQVSVSLPVLAVGADDAHLPFWYVHRAQALARDIYHAQIAVDGSYGPATAAAVMALQRAHGLPATGTVDAATWKLLLSAQA